MPGVGGGGRHSLIWPIPDVPLDRVWFLFSLFSTGYIISHKSCPNGKQHIACQLS